MKKYRFIGLDRDVWLPDDIVVEIAIVPSTVRNVRSNTQFSGQTSYTQHETANFNRGANADMHKRWLHSGAGGAYVGFNFAVDDKKIIQLTPLNEITWAAGTPEGNKFSYHTELCVNNDINHTKARRNAAALAGGIFAAKGWNTNNLRQHRYWTGKWCPKLMLDQGYWPQFVNQVSGATIEAKKGTNGSATPPQSPTSFKAGDTLKTTASLNVRTGDSTKYDVVTTLKPETTVKVITDNSGAFVKNNDGYTWYNISFGGGTGWAVADYMIKVKSETSPTPAPSTAWPYPNPIAPSFWGALNKDGVTHIFDADYLWVNASETYEVVKETPRLRVAGGNEKVGPNLKVKDRFRSAAVGHAADGKVYVITPELTRVAIDDLKLIRED